jgi:hypothetical protein
VLSFFFRYCLYFLFPSFLSTFFPLSPRPLSAPLPCQSCPLLHSNGHPFLLAFTTYSLNFCDILQSIFRHIHFIFRHRTTEPTLQQDFGTDDPPDPYVKYTKEIWSVVNHSRLARRYFSPLCELRSENSWLPQRAVDFWMGGWRKNWEDFGNKWSLRVLE